MTGTALSPSPGYRLFPSPEAVLAEMPLPPAATAGVARSRAEVRAVLDGTDDRLLVITGPCPGRDPEAALGCAELLAGTGLERDLLIVMRAYPEPVTGIGRTAPLRDPAGDGSQDALRGLREARRLLAGLAMLGMPAACAWPGPVAPHYLADAVAWSAIGAIPTESQACCQLASALPMPAGLIAADGDAQAAAEACKAAAAGHMFLGINEAGAVGVVTSRGNPDCHVVLRGGRHRPSCGPSTVAVALEVIERSGLPRRLVIDISRGSGEGRRQDAAAIAVAGQVAAGERGIAGVMLDSFLTSGHREPGLLSSLSYARAAAAGGGTGFPAAAILETLAAAARTRRQLTGASR